MSQRYIPHHNRNRFVIDMTVEVNQDVVPGTFHDIDSVVKNIEHFITSPIPHYNPVVTIQNARMSGAKAHAYIRHANLSKLEEAFATLPIKAIFVPEGVHRISSGDNQCWTFSVSTDSINQHISSMELCEFLNEFGFENEVPGHNKYKDGMYPDGATAMGMMDLYCAVTCAVRFHDNFWLSRGHKRFG